MPQDDIPRYHMYIDGEWVDATDSDEIRDPATERLVADAARGTVEHVDRAVEGARRAFESGVWSGLQPEQRSAVMLRIADRLNDRMDELACLQVRENGATIRQALGFHIGVALLHWAQFAEAAATYPFEEPLGLSSYPVLSTSVVRREPIGVCSGILPWNFPLVLAVWKMGPALAAGNSVVMKPDEKTPLTLLEFARVAEECGLPRGVLNVVTGGKDVGARLASHPDIGKVAFTGSTAAGRDVMRRASETVKRVTLELGGKSPVIVLDDADVETAVDAVLYGCFLYSGQVCGAGTRLLLPESLHDDFVERMVARTRTITIGDPADHDTDLGPLISAAQHERVLNYLKVAQAEGATVAHGGSVPTGGPFGKGYWVEPTILTDVRNDMRVAQEEVFGPVLSVLRYGDDDEAVHIANDTPYGLAASVWSRDTGRALDIAGRLRAGTVWVNEGPMANFAAPFGGYRQSGLGRELGLHAIDEYVEQKHLYLDLSGRLDARPYDIVLSEPGRPAR